MHATRTRPAIEVSADGIGVVSHAGSRLLADRADRTTLTAQLSAVFTGRVAPQTVHDPGRVLTDVAVMIADGGQCISDIATLADQPAVFGAVASDSTCWRVLDAVTDTDLVAIDAARSAAREVAVGAARRDHRDHAAGFDGGRAAIAGCTCDAEAESWCARFGPIVVSRVQADTALATGPVGPAVERCHRLPTPKPTELKPFCAAQGRQLSGDDDKFEGQAGVKPPARHSPKH